MEGGKIKAESRAIVLIEMLVAIFIFSLVVGLSFQLLHHVRSVSRRIENDLYKLNVVSRLMSDIRADVRSAERVIGQTGDDVLLLQKSDGTVAYAIRPPAIAGRDGSVERWVVEGGEAARVYNAPCKFLRFDYDSSGVSRVPAIIARAEFEFGDIRRPYVYRVTLYTILRNHRPAPSPQSADKGVKGGFYQ